MSDFDPGPGWHEVPSSTGDSAHDRLALFHAESGESRYWVREAPVPPLPTAPYTVIRARMKSDNSEREFQLRPTNRWLPSQDDPATSPRYIDSELAGLITSFEVLSEPRAVTAKAVLARVRAVHLSALGQIPARIPGPEMDAIAREFGVSDE